MNLNEFYYGYVVGVFRLAGNSSTFVVVDDDVLTGENEKMISAGPLSRYTRSVTTLIIK